MSFFKFVRSGKLAKLAQQIKSEIKAELNIKGDGLQPLFVESCVYSEVYGIGGSFCVISLLWWNWHSSTEQCDRILSKLNSRENWQEKIDDVRAKTILDCDSVKIAMLIQANRDTNKEKVDDSSTRIHKAYEVFLDSLREESKNDFRKEELQNHIANLQSNKKGDLLVLMVDGEKKEEKEGEDASEKSGESGSVAFRKRCESSFVAFRKRWFPLPWEQWPREKEGEQWPREKGEKEEKGGGDGSEASGGGLSVESTNQSKPAQEGGTAVGISTNHTSHAFLDYYDLPYKVIEVNPISKKELKWSDYKKAPVVVVDGEQIVNSSDIIDQSYKKVHSANSTIDADEESKYRKWVEDHFVHLLSPNLYRNNSEALESFDYISSHGNFNFTERITAKYARAAAMYFVSKKLKKKHIITDQRAALYESAETWVDALKSRDFLGGSNPNLADHAVFGVLRPIHYLKSDIIEQLYKKVRSADSTFDADEESKWRKWVDDHLVHMLSPYLYRNNSETFESFDYITSHGNFSFTDRITAKYAGAAAMYFVSKKYNITGERAALYKAAETWFDALKGRDFLGGSNLNLADLTVFSVSRPIRYLKAVKDMLENTRIGDWYSRMESAVGVSARIQA